MKNVTAIKKLHVERHAEARIRTALTDTRIVAIVGPRQSGKTTLARHIASDAGYPFLTLDDDQSLKFAREDSSGFLRGYQTAVIDEIQRAPGLILALKRSVDEDNRPGRFLITGSVDLFRSSISPDSLAGRVETIELLPFSQAEIEQNGDSRFLERAFHAEFPSLSSTGSTTDLVGRVLRGGYPEAVARVVPARRRRWLQAYADALAQRDVSDIAILRETGRMRRTVDHAALAAGNLLNLSRLGASLGADSKTVGPLDHASGAHVSCTACSGMASQRIETPGQDPQASVHGFGPARRAAGRGCTRDCKGQEPAWMLAGVFRPW